jgi:hypothetical protein
MMLVKGQMRSIFQSFVMTLYAHWSSFSLDGWLMNGWMDERKIDRLGREPHLGGKHGDREMGLDGCRWIYVRTIGTIYKQAVKASRRRPESLRR